MYSHGGGAAVVDAGFFLSSRERKDPSKAFPGTFRSSKTSTSSSRALSSSGTTLISKDGNGSTTTTSPASQQQENQHDGGLHALWAVALAGLASMVFLCLVAASFCTKRRHCRRRRHRNTAIQRAEAAAAEAASPEGSSTAIAASKIRQQSPEERYAIIEAWLVSKTVTGHDAVCDRVRATKTMSSSLRSSGSLSSLGDNKTTISSTVKNHTSVSVVGTENLATDRDIRNQNSNECNECPICFDTIEPGDVVSWSPQPDCGHVFHHECIKGGCIVLSVLSLENTRTPFGCQ